MLEIPEHRHISAIPHLGRLQSRIRLAGQEEQLSAALEGLLEQLPHSIAAAAYAALRLARAQEEAVAAILRREEADPNTIKTFQLDATVHDPAAFAIDNFLDAGRRTQNAMWPYLSKVLRLSMPKSLSRLTNMLMSNSSRVPKRIAQPIIDYWNCSGRSLKDYRDLGQHHAVVSSDGRITILPDGRAAIYLVLPNNPTEKDTAKLKYLDPRIDALHFVWKSYWDLYALVFEVTHVLLSYTTEPEMELATIRYKGGHRMGARDIDAHEPITKESIVSQFVVLRDKLQVRLDAELPRAEIKPTLILTPRDASA